MLFLVVGLNTTYSVMNFYLKWGIWQDDIRFRLTHYICWCRNSCAPVGAQAQAEVFHSEKFKQVCLFARLFVILQGRNGLCLNRKEEYETGSLLR